MVSTASQLSFESHLLFHMTARPLSAVGAGRMTDTRSWNRMPVFIFLFVRQRRQACDVSCPYVMPSWILCAVWRSCQRTAWTQDLEKEKPMEKSHDGNSSNRSPTRSVSAFGANPVRTEGSPFTTVSHLALTLGRERTVRAIIFSMATGQDSRARKTRRIDYMSSKRAVLTA